MRKIAHSVLLAGGGGGEACTALANSGGEGLRHEGKKLGLRESINPELMELRVL